MADTLSAILEDPRPIGRLERLFAHLRLRDTTPDDEILVWLPGSWAGNHAETMRAALAREPAAAFALARWRDADDEPPHLTPALTLNALIESPMRQGPIAVRLGALRSLNPQDFGPADAVADAAAEWLLAIALLARGHHGLVLEDAIWRRTETHPEEAFRLTPEGVAWLVQLAMRVAPKTDFGPLVTTWRSRLPAIAVFAEGHEP